MIKQIISDEPTHDNLQQTLKALSGFTGVDRNNNLWICGKPVMVRTDLPADYNPLNPPTTGS